ncbi:TetR family transcriptional regulator [Nocardia ninae]|uniref:Putative TetR family regulatory protein n=1 Tax=Nocardia ninae NBRC 108245 TaxID=1210091 RepID=A0A511ME31_9NOCA|nr:TetR family transcriptional regulator [Nocardia ninae]GEM38348.1 putative TetR family regulatory protein [Nocardia ninae NBRC 108245]
MPPDASETKRRILAAARAEFAQFGLAGARIDRIAAEAHANKRSIYVHFGPKEHLFDLVVERALTELSAAVPFTPDDLPGYGGRLFDHLLADPAVLRLSTWANLERPEANSGEIGAYRPKIAALRDHFDGNAIDLLALTLGLVTAWFNASPSLQSLAAEDPWSRERLESHRDAMVAAIAALCAEIGRPRDR